MSLLSPVGDVLKGLFGAPQAAPQGAPADAQGAAAPQPQTTGGAQQALPMAQSYMHPTRDAILSFFGGALGRLDQSLQQQDAMRYNMARFQYLTQGMTPQQAHDYALSPEEYGKDVVNRDYAPQTLKQGELLVNGPQGNPVYNPETGIDPVSGRPYAVGMNGSASAGPTLGGGFDVKDGVAFSPRLGVLGTYSQPQKLAPGESPGSFMPSISGVSPASGQGPSLPVLQPGSGSQTAQRGAPRGVRNNNFGNVRSVPGGWQGQTGVDNQGYAVFDSPENGIRAADLNLQAYANHGINTIAGVVNRWAPTGDGANNPTAYAQRVSQLTGIPVNQQINLADPNVRAQLLPAIFQVENGRAVGRGTSQTAQSAPQQSQGAPSAAQAAQPASATGQAAPAGWSIGQPNGRPRTLSPQEAQAKGYAPGAVVEEDAAGHDTVSQPTQWGSEQAIAMRNHVLTSDEYKQEQAAMSAYGAMKANAAQMSGPGAYAMLDTFVRTINPGAVARVGSIQAMQETFGWTQQEMGKFRALFGQGTLSPVQRQQILDAVIPFAQGHWDQANALNQANAGIARAHGMREQDVVVPLGDRPEHFTASSAAPKGAPVHLDAKNPDADYARLPKGAQYIGPDGVPRVK